MRSLHTGLRLLILALILAPLGQGQALLVPGQIVAAAGSAVLVMDAGGTVVDSYPITVSVDHVLWDPNQPDSVIASGGGSGSTTGFLVRLSFTRTGGVTSVTTSSIRGTGTFSRPEGLAWSQNGQEVIFADNYDGVFSVSVGTGAVSTLLGQSMQSWTRFTAVSTAVDPFTGDVLVASSDGSVHRVANGTSTPLLTGVGSVVDLLVSNVGGPRYLYVGGSNQLRRWDLGNLAAGSEDYYSSLLVPGPGSNPSNGLDLAFDDNGDLVTRHDFYFMSRVSARGSLTTSGVNVGLRPTPLGRFLQSSSRYPREITVVGGRSNGFRHSVENLDVAPTFRRDARIIVENYPTGTTRGFLLLTADTARPVGTGPFFGVFPDFFSLNILLGPTTNAIFSFDGAVPTPSSFTTTGDAMRFFFGDTIDTVAIAFDASNRYLGRTNIVRSSWP